MQPYENSDDRYTNPRQYSGDPQNNDRHSHININNARNDNAKQDRQLELAEDADT